MRLLDLVALLTWLQLAPVSAQIGRDCSSTRACMPHQTCYLGYCSCNRGYVRNERHCFPVRKYGETCFFDSQCVDHRMTCKNSSMSSFKHCLCDRFHEWSLEVQECIQSMNVTDILNGLEVTNSLESIEREVQNLFVWIVAAGLTVAAILACIAVTCIVYGCCLYECYDWCTKESPDLESRTPLRCPSCRTYYRAQV